jgi:excisionase family DNA binding protein
MGEAREYLSVGAAASRFGVHSRMIYKEIAEKRLPAIKLGDPNSRRPVIRIPIEALQRWELEQLKFGDSSA